MMNKEEMLEIKGYTEWSVAPEGMLICPCGFHVEDDGKCPDGHESPIRQEGMI